MKKENQKTTKMSVKVIAAILVFGLLLSSVAVVISALLGA